MRERGVVISTRGLTAQVRFEKGSHCEGCNACQAFGDGSAVLEVRNEVHAVPGDVVEVEIPPREVLTSSFIVFIVPALCLIVGYLVASRALGAGEGASVLAAFAGLLIGFAGVRLYDRILANRNNCTASIVQKVAFSELSGNLSEESSHR